MAAFCSEFGGAVGISLTHLFGTDLCAEEYLLSSCIRYFVNLAKCHPYHSRNSFLRNVQIFPAYQTELHGPGGVVGIATGYGLDGPGIESR